MLMPKRVKYRKPHSAPRIKGVAKGNTELHWGEYGLKAMEPRWITARQIEACRVTIVKYLKKKGKMWIRIFPDKPITKKGTEVPMGGGKGSVDHYAFPVKPGRVIFELDGLKEDVARDAFSKAGDKLPIKTKFIRR